MMVMVEADASNLYGYVCHYCAAAVAALCVRRARSQCYNLLERARFFFIWQWWNDESLQIPNLMTSFHVFCFFRFFRFFFLFYAFFSFFLFRFFFFCWLGVFKVNTGTKSASIAPQIVCTKIKTVQHFQHSLQTSLVSSTVSG